MSETLTCGWQTVGHPACGRVASHVRASSGDDGTPQLRYFCRYHAGVARRDGWTGIRKLAAA